MTARCSKYRADEVSVGVGGRGVDSSNTLREARVVVGVRLIGSKPFEQLPFVCGVARVALRPPGDRNAHRGDQSAVTTVTAFAI